MGAPALQIKLSKLTFNIFQNILSKSQFSITKSRFAMSLIDKRKFSPFLPTYDMTFMCFPPLPHIPYGVFREHAGEVLGPRASKFGPYCNPEYFAYHNMSFFDLTYHLQGYRLPVPDSKRK